MDFLQLVGTPKNKKQEQLRMKTESTTALHNSCPISQVSIWVSDTDCIYALNNLSSVAEICLYNRRELSSGTNYFIDDGNTPEWQIRNMCWQNPDSCYVHRVNTPLEYLIGEAFSAKEFFSLMLDNALPFADWAKRKDKEPLTIKEAIQIAQIAYKYKSGLDLEVELDTLRVRCNQNSYDWNRCMAKLEKEFYQELERRGILNYSTDPSERLKLEIKRYIAEKDEAKKALIAKELRKQGISNQDIKAIASQLDNSFATPKGKFFSSYDLLNYEPEVAPWLIPGLLPSTGVALLAGDPGIGKSTLAYDCGYSVISGKPFLGETPARVGKVLFLTGDEPFNQLREKIITRGFFEYMGMFDVIHNWDISQNGMLEEKLEQLRPALVIIDSFSSIHQSEVFDENSSNAAREIRKLNPLLERYNCAGLMIHHTNKNKEQKGIHKVRGNTGITAAATAVWLLTGEGNVRRFTTPKLRGSEPIDWNISLDIHSGRFDVVSGNEEIQQSKSVIGRVRELFERLGHDTRLEFLEVKAQVSGTDSSLRKALERLCNQGIIVKTPGKGGSSKVVYHLSSKYIPSTPPPSNDSVNLSNKISETFTKQSVEILDKSLDKPWDNVGQDVEQVPINTPCPITENHAGQGFGQDIGQASTSEEGGEVVQDVGQVANETNFDSEVKEQDTIAGSAVSKATAPIPLNELQPGDIIESPDLPLGMNGQGEVVSIDGEFCVVKWCVKSIRLESITQIRRG